MKKFLIQAIFMMAIFLAFILVGSRIGLSQVFDGQPVNATVTNNAYWKRSVNDTGSGIYGLLNVATSSGSSITNMQREFNACSSYTGLPLNSVYNVLPVWSNNDVGTSSDTLKTRSDDLTARFNGASGHMHTGAIGDAPPLSDSGITVNAGIARTKIAAGSPGQVVIDDPISGYLATEAHLAPSRGGSGVGNSGNFNWGPNDITLNTTGVTNITVPVSGTVIRRSDLSATAPLSYDSVNGVFSTSGGSGTVTSVNVTVSPTGILSTSGFPITASGTGTLSFDSEPANFIFSGPSSGVPAAPIFRKMVNGDIPVSGVTAGTYTSSNITVNSQGIVTGASNGSGSFSASQVVFDTPNGFGAGGTANRIRNFTNVTTVGTDITGSVSGTNGAIWTINTTGIYAFTCNDANNSGTDDGVGFSLNATGTQLTGTTGNIFNLPQSVVITYTDAINGRNTSVSATRSLSATDKVRYHTANGAISGTSANEQCSAVRVQ